MKSRFIRMISLRDISLIFFSWVVKKFLDFLWEKGKTRLRFEEQTHIRRYLLVMFGEHLLMILFRMLAVYSENWLEQKGKVSEYREYVRIFLSFHRKYHMFVGSELCCICFNIIAFRSHLEKYVPNPKLYPPFNF